MATLVTSVRQTNAVRPREIAWYRHTMTEDVLPRIDINVYPPTQGAIAYNSADATLYYGDGLAWNPLANGSPATLGTVPGALGQTIVGDGVGPDLTVKGLHSLSPFIVIASTATDVTFSVSHAYKTITIAESPYALLPDDMKVGVHTLTGAITVTLPLAATKRVYYITDIDGNSNINHITINASGADTIGVPGGAPIIVNSRYATIVLYSDGVSAWFLE